MRSFRGETKPNSLFYVPAQPRSPRSPRWPRPRSQRGVTPGTEHARGITGDNHILGSGHPALSAPSGAGGFRGCSPPWPSFLLLGLQPQGSRSCIWRQRFVPLPPSLSPAEGKGAKQLLEKLSQGSANGDESRGPAPLPVHKGVHLKRKTGEK